MKLSPFLKYGIIFSVIPMVSTYILGHIFKIIFLPDLESMAKMPLDDPERTTFPIIEYVFPFALLSGLIALTSWFVFMRKTPSKLKGVIAGLVTVFMSYPLLGFAIGFIYPDHPDRLTSSFNGALMLSLFGNIITFWLTYPFGALCGWFISKRMLLNIVPQYPVFD